MREVPNDSGVDIDFALLPRGCLSGYSGHAACGTVKNSGGSAATVSFGNDADDVSGVVVMNLKRSSIHLGQKLCPADIFGWALGYKLAVGEEQQTVGIVGRGGQIVQDNQAGVTVVGEVSEPVHRGFLVPDVHGRKRLVEKEDRHVLGVDAGEGGALPFAAGNLWEGCVAEWFQVVFFDHAVDDVGVLVGLGCAVPAVSAHGHDFFDGEGESNIIILAHDSPLSGFVEH